MCGHACTATTLNWTTLIKRIFHLANHAKSPLNCPGLCTAFYDATTCNSLPPFTSIWLAIASLVVIAVTSLTRAKLLVSQRLTLPPFTYLAITCQGPLASQHVDPRQGHFLLANPELVYLATVSMLALYPAIDQMSDWTLVCSSQIWFPTCRD